MEVHLTPQRISEACQMAGDTGRRSDELVQDAAIGLFDELAALGKARSAYDDLESGGYS